MKEISEIFNEIFPVSKDSLDRVLAITDLENHNKGTDFIQKDKRDSKEYFLLDGICRSYLLNPEGEEITIAFYREGSVLSPYVTRTVRGVSNLNFQALTDIKLGTLDEDLFLDLMVKYIDIREFGNMVLKLELQKKVEKEIGQASLTAKERLIKFRRDYQMFENLVPHGTIATYLGITTISLSRLRKELVQ
jgi:CRP-like cAMP-binding protein